jgi:predicted ferric reductase
MDAVRSRKVGLLAAIVVTSAFPLLFVRMDEPTVGLNVYKLLAKAGSLSGSMLIVWQFLLGHRATVGKIVVDLLWVLELHKSIGKYILLLIVLHPIFITVYYVIKEDINPLALRTGQAFDTYVLLGMIALGIFVFVVATSLWLRSRLAFQSWYTMHLSSYLALPLVFVHSFPIGQTIEGTGLDLFWRILLGIVVAFALYRLICRLGLGVRPHAVTQVREVGAEVTEITARPEGPKLTPAIGQFVYFRRGLHGAIRPFTVSLYDPETGDLSVTVKAQGTTTTDLQATQPGEMVYIDGPYGVFSREALQTDRPLAMVAGGIGITPFLRLCQELAPRGDRELFLFYGNRRKDEIIYKDEFEQMERVRLVHVLSDEPDYEGETGFITPELLRKYLQRDLKDHEFLICGPPVMTTKLESELKGEGVPDEQIHHELFSY